MMRFTHFVAASFVAFTLSGNLTWAGDSPSQVTADWQDGYSPAYSGRVPGYPQIGNGPVDYGQYEQWSPDSNQSFGDSGYFPPVGNPLSSPAGGFYRAPAPWRHGCHHGSCRQGSFDNFGGNSMPRSSYPNSQWGLPGYGAGNGSAFGPGMGQSFGAGASGVPSFQMQNPAYGAPSNFAPPPFPGQAYPSQNYGAPNPAYNSLPNTYNPNTYNQVPNSYNSQPNSYNRQPNSFSQPQNLYGASRNSFGTPAQSFTQPGAGYGQPGSSYSQPGSNFGLQGPLLGQPQTSPFYP